MSRIRIFLYRLFGLRAGRRNRLEAIRCRRLAQIQIGNYNAFTEGCWLWPRDAEHDSARIRIGNRNYFNRGVMLDACGLIEIGDDNMFGPGVYITDSDHGFGKELQPATAPMKIGSVKIGNRCWIGAKAIILKNVELGDDCVIGAGAVVTAGVPAGSTVVGVPARPIGRS